MEQLRGVGPRWPLTGHTPPQGLPLGFPAHSGLFLLLLVSKIWRGSQNGAWTQVSGTQGALLTTGSLVLGAH